MQENNQERDDAQEKAPRGSDEYNKQMIERFEKGTGTVEESDYEAPQIPSMPENGFEKFYDSKTGQYNWQDHAKELQYKLDQKAAPNDEKKDGKAAADDSEKEKEEAEAVTNIVEAAGLKMEDLRTQIINDGKLDDKSIDALVNKGIPRELVTEYVESVSFRLKANTEQAMGYAGGEDGWRQLHDWAADNLTDAEKTRYNGMLQSTDPSEWRVAIDTLKTKMASNMPGSRESKLMMGTRASNGQVSGYRSRAEQTKAMQDPRYRTDAAYRRQVQAKIGQSNYEDDLRPS